MKKTKTKKGSIGAGVIIAIVIIVGFILVGGGFIFYNNLSDPVTVVEDVVTSKDKDTVSEEVVANEEPLGEASESNVNIDDEKIVTFTAIYSSVSIFEDGLGGELISIEPDTEYLQEEMFRKVVWFVPDFGFDGVEFIGMERPVDATQKNPFELSDSQKIKIQGFYHKKQHRPYANSVELIE